MKTTKIKLTEFRNWLKSEDWRIYTNTFENGLDWHAFKSIKGFKDCLCNKRPPSIYIKPRRLGIGRQEYISVDFEVRGETSKKQWVRFQIYSLKLDEAKKHYKMIVRKLRDAWNVARGLDDRA